MYTYYFTTVDELDAVLSDGIPMSDGSTGVARKPNVTWLTENSIPSAPPITDRDLIAKLQPDSTRWPPNYSVSEQETNLERAFRVRVRIRSVQATPWLWRVIDSYETAYKNRVAIREFDDGWFVMRQPITPNQITRVDEWSADENEWRKLRLVRRLERPAAGQFASLHCRQPSLRVPGTPSASTMVGSSRSNQWEHANP